MWLQDIKKSEYILGVIKTTAVFLLILYVFYGTFAAAPFLIPVWFLYMRDWIRDTAGKKEQQFRVQFRDSIQEMSAVLKAGYSVENAIREVSRELVPLYDKESRIRKEYDRMTHQLELKMPIAEVLEQFAERTGQEDVEDFVNVFAAAKKSGGDSITIIRNAVRIISGKIDTEKEIQTMIASNKLEFEIMCAVPFAIILYMKLTFGEFLSVLYGNMAGMIIMTVCLCVYIAAYCIGRRIIRIDV